MTLRNAAGDILNKTELTALTTQEPVVQPDRRFTAKIIETFEIEGESEHERGSRLKFKTGDVISQADLDALFDAAAVASITPATGDAAGGDDVVILGSNLSGVEGVTFGGTPATDVVVVNSGRVTCTTPAHAAGAVAVVVKDDSGDVTVAAGFTYE